MAEDCNCDSPNVQTLGVTAVEDDAPVCAPGLRGAQGRTGARGASGTDGRETVAYTLADFTMPAEGATVAITLNTALAGGSYWLMNGLVVFIAGAGYMLTTNAATLTFQNLGYSGNATGGATIAAGALLTPAAPRGADAPAVNRGYVLIEQRAAAATDAGTFTAGSYLPRLLNTIVHDTQSNVVLLDALTGEFTLKAGTYEFSASAPAYSVQRHKARLRNVTASGNFPGTSEYAGDGGQTNSIVENRFTISVDTVFVLEHRAQNTQSNYGFGIASNFTDGGGTDYEKYAFIELWLVAP